MGNNVNLSKQLAALVPISPISQLLPKNLLLNSFWSTGPLMIVIFYYEIYTYHKGVTSSKVKKTGFLFTLVQ